jgi:diguanylate cyclase (GGDEF)-like protein
VSSEPFRLVEGDLAYVMFRPIISSFAAENQRQKVPSDISYALLVVRTQDLLPSQDSLSTAVRHHALRDDEAGKQSLTLFDIGGTPASKLESYLLPKLRAERSVGDVSQPLRLMLERQLRFNDMSFSAFSLAGMASLLSCAMLLGFLRSHERRRRAFDEGRRAIEHMALHDALTAIPNRFLMLAHLEQAISLAQRHDMKVAVMFLDLDEFKPINDLLGHSTGDLVLQEIARRLQTCIRDCDTTSRYGGDEFVILLTGISGEEDAALVASKVLEAIVQPIQTGSETVTISASIGIAIFPDHGSNAKALIGEADKAMYLAKQNGSGQFAFSGTGQEAGTANVTPDACYP